MRLGDLGGYHVRDLLDVRTGVVRERTAPDHHDHGAKIITVTSEVRAKESAILPP